jgi:hypothetical protein
MLSDFLRNKLKGWIVGPVKQRGPNQTVKQVQLSVDILSRLTTFLSELSNINTYVQIKRVMVFNTTFNNISVISCQSVLLVEEIREYAKKT